MDGSRPATAQRIDVAPERALLTDFVRLYPFQPATAFWRWFEVDALLRRDLPRGLGLDLGCGDGLLTQLVADRVGGWRLVGVDPDPAEVALARSCPAYSRLHAAPGERIPEPDGAFDFVFSNSVLEHIPDVKPVLREARRLLRPGGQFVATVPSGDFHACMAGPPIWWRALYRPSREEYLAEFDRRIAHCYYWTDTEWRDALKQAGFGAIELVPYFPREMVRRWEWIANHTSGLLFKLAGGQSRPIEIQRSLHLRRGGQRTPGLLVAPLAAILARHATIHPRRPALFGCRLVLATA